MKFIPEDFAGNIADLKSTPVSALVVLKNAFVVLPQHSHLSGKRPDGTIIFHEKVVGVASPQSCITRRAYASLPEAH